MKRLLTTVLLLFALGGTCAQAQPGYRPVDVSQWSPAVADHPLDLLKQLYEGFPEALEGRPAMRMNMTKSKDGKSLTIALEMTGYLDDFLQGERFLATVTREGQKWRLKSLWKQWKCYRGQNKGWHLQQCP